MMREEGATVSCSGVEIHKGKFRLAGFGDNLSKRDLVEIIRQLEENDDCGAGVAGCLNALKQCRACQVAAFKAQNIGLAVKLKTALEMLDNSRRVYEAPYLIGYDGILRPRP